MGEDLMMDNVGNDLHDAYEKGYGDGFAEGFERGKTMPRTDENGNYLISEKEHDMLYRSMLIAMYLRDLIDMVKEFNGEEAEDYKMAEDYCYCEGEEDG